MRHLRTVVAGVLATGLMIGLPVAVAGSASADFTKSPPPPPPGPSVVVDKDGFATVSNCGAAVATFSTIQAGVNAAASGATVKVCPGTYPESVIVNKPLTIQGAQVGVDGRTRVPSSESIVTSPTVDAGGFILAADNITIDGFELLNGSGPGVTTNNDHSGYKVQNNIITGNVMGVYANSNGTYQSVIQLNGIHDNNNGAGSAPGNGIYEDQGTRNLLIQNNVISNETNTGVLLFQVPTAAPKLGAFGVTISTNTMQNDITFVAIWDSTNVTVNNNTMSNSPINLAGNSGIFIGAPSSNTQINSNTIFQADFSGIAVRDNDAYGNPQPGATTGVILQNNTITGAGNHGIDVTAQAPGAVRTSGNQSKNNAGNGIFYSSVTNNNTINGNTATGNGVFDCQDLSHGSGTSGTANSWSSNTGNTSSPAGLCVRAFTK